MPFCMKCGSELKATYKFCGKCGYPVQPIAQTTQNKIEIQNKTASHQPVNIICLRCGITHKLSDKICWNCGCPNPPQSGQSRFDSAPQHLLSRREYVEELDRMIDYFSKAQSWYDDYYTYLREKEKKEAEYRRTPEYKNLKHQYNQKLIAARRRRKATFGLLMTSSIVIAIIALLTTPFISKYHGWPLALLFIFFSLALCIALMVVGFLVMNKPTTVKANDDILQPQSQADPVYIKLREYYKEYGYCILGFEDTDPRKIRLIRDCIKSRKAKTLEDASKIANKKLQKTYPDITP